MSYRTIESWETTALDEWNYTRSFLLECCFDPQRHGVYMGILERDGATLEIRPCWGFLRITRTPPHPRLSADFQLPAPHRFVSVGDYRIVSIMQTFALRLAGKSGASIRRDDGGYLHCPYCSVRYKLAGWMEKHLKYDHSDYATNIVK